MSHKAEPPAVWAGGTADERSTKSDSDTYVNDLRRRREASWRLPPLDCGCRDPWPCRCYDPPPSEKVLDGAEAAAWHLLGAGLGPLFDSDTIWGLRHRDRRLCAMLARLAGVA